MKKLLTVIVPAYNMEAYIENNLDSLCQEDVLEELEVILVDDGSTDRTGKLADIYQSKYPNTIKAIHKQNGGHGSGINAGVKHASGLYLKVVEADDWVDQKGVRNLIDYLRIADSDVVITGFYWAYDDGSGNEQNFRRKAEIKQPFKGVIYKKRYEFDEVADKIYVKMHGLTIRTEILKKNHIVIDENCFYVDTEFVLYPVPYIKTISFLEDFVYLYRIGRNDQSINPDRMMRYYDNYSKVLKALLNFYKQCYEGEISCSREKRLYIAGVIARVVAGNIKILLAGPQGNDSKYNLKAFDDMLREDYPEIYLSNKSWPVMILRMSKYSLYSIASKILLMKNRRS